MGIDLYYTITSPPCISVRVLAKALDIELNLKTIDVMNGEHKSSEFLKLNPQHCVPTLVDNGFSLWESRAILQYLCDRYDKEGKFYPRETKERIIVNRLLFFDLGTFYKVLVDYFETVKDKTDDTEAKKKVNEALEHLNDLLVGHKWLAGEQLTIADIVVHVNMGLLVLLQYDFTPYSNVRRWIERGKKEIPGNEIIENTFKLLAERLKAMQQAQARNS